MLKLRQALALLLVLTVFGALLGYFPYRPSYTQVGDDQALIQVSFTTGGKRIGNCIRRSRAELAKLPPHKRKAVVCPRERHPISLRQLALRLEVQDRDGGHADLVARVLQQGLDLFQG